MKKLTTGVAIAAVLAVGLSIAFAKGVLTHPAGRADAPVRQPQRRTCEWLHGRRPRNPARRD